MEMAWLLPHKNIHYTHSPKLVSSRAYHPLLICGGESLNFFGEKLIWKVLFVQKMNKIDIHMQKKNMH